MKVSIAMLAFCGFIGTASAQPYPYSDHWGPYGPPGRSWDMRTYRDRWDPPAMYPRPQWRRNEYPEYRGRMFVPRPWIYGRPWREY